MRGQRETSHHLLPERREQMTRIDYPELDETLYQEVLPNGLTVCVVPRKGFT